MIDLDKIKIREGLAAFYDGSQYDGSQYWFDSFYGRRVTVVNGAIGENGSVLLRPKKEGSKIVPGYIDLGTIPSKGFLGTRQWTAYILASIDEVKGNDYYQFIDLPGYLGFGINKDKKHIHVVDQQWFHSLIYEPKKYYLFTVSNGPVGPKLWYFNNELVRLDYQNWKEGNADWSNSAHINYIGDRSEAGQIVMSIKSILIYREGHNEYQIAQTQNCLADMYNMPELVNREKLVAAIPRFDAIAMASVAETNSSRTDCFKKIINSYKVGFH